MKDKILGIVPARGGSKSIKDKNIVPLNGKPLIYYTISESLKAQTIDRVIVSTDSPKIAKITESLGAEVPYMRPKYLATDTSKTIDAVLHLLDFLAKTENYEPEIVVLLQPTSPLRKSLHIDEAVGKFLKSDAESLVSLCRLQEPHPYKLKIIEDGLVCPFFKNADSSIPKQLLPDVYRLNGALYITYRSTLYNYKDFFGKKVLPYIMEDCYSVNIDSPIDLKIADLILKEESGEF